MEVMVNREASVWKLKGARQVLKRSTQMVGQGDLGRIAVPLMTPAAFLAGPPIAPAPEPGRTMPVPLIVAPVTGRPAEAITPLL
jgi:hypothetical protein